MLELIKTILLWVFIASNTLLIITAMTALYKTLKHTYVPDTYEKLELLFGYLGLAAIGIYAIIGWM